MLFTLVDMPLYRQNHQKESGEPYAIKYEHLVNVLSRATEFITREMMTTSGKALALLLAKMSKWYL